MNLEQFSNSFTFGNAFELGVELEIWLTKNRKIKPVALDILSLAGEKAGLNENLESIFSEKGFFNKAGERWLNMIKEITGLSPEFPAGQIEINTKAYNGINLVLNDLRNKTGYLKYLAETLGCILSFNPAPDFKKEELLIFPLKRYQDILAHYGNGENLKNFFAAAFQLHISVESKKHAIAVLNAFSSTMMEAFSFAYSEKRLVRYQRAVANSMLIPPQIKDWDHFCQLMKELGVLDDHTKCHWLARIHGGKPGNPKNTTVELRICDSTNDFDKIFRIIETGQKIVKNA